MTEFIVNDEKHYSVYIWQDEMIHYLNIFEKFGYYGNGVSWEELCKTFFELEDLELLKVISFDTEAGQATFYVKDSSSQTQVAQIIHNWTTNKEKLKLAFGKVNSLYME